MTFQPFSLTVEVAFNDGVWATSPTWTDITRYVRSVSTTMGRQHELQQVNPSTATISLTNAPDAGGGGGGRFSPWNTSSPYYNSGNGLTPGHPVRIQATIASTTYNVFYGYTKSWVPSYGQVKSDVTLNCYDGMALINLAMMDANLYTPQVIADGATAYWECQDPGFSQTFYDSTGHGHTAVLSGAGTFGPGGALTSVADQCMAFTGFGLMSTPITPASVGHVMFEGWFQTADTKETLMSWAVDETAGVVYGISLVTTSTGVPALVGGALNVFAAIPSSFTLVQGFTPISDGEWHHCVVQVPCTDATGTYTLWVDGQLIGSGANSSYPWTSGTAAAALVGGAWSTADGGVLGKLAGFIGSIDQIAYYQTPLTSAQIANHHSLGSAGFVVQDSGTRVQTVLESLANVPSALVNCQTGAVQVQGALSALNLQTASSYLQQIVNTERGLLYQDATGVFQFKNRWYVYTNTTSTTSQMTFAYDGSGQYFTPKGFVPQSDDTDLYNDIPVARQGGVVQYASDATSITNNGRRTLQGYTSLLFVNDNDAEALAGGLLYQYKDPKPRVRAISTSSVIDNGAPLPLVLSLNLLDRVTIIWRPADGTPVDFNQQSLVEQITHTIVPGKWDTTLAVTPIGTETFGFWGSGIWDTSVWGF
jgi:hypothetical protein